MESDLAQRMDRLGISLLSIVVSSSAFLLSASPPPKGSSIDSDWSIKNKKQPGFLRLISAWYAMVSLQFSHRDLALTLTKTLFGARPVGEHERTQQEEECSKA